MEHPPTTRLKNTEKFDSHLRPFYSKKPLSMAYEALIWDLDGTLVESLPGIGLAANQALAAHGHPTHSSEAIRSFIGDGSWMLMRRALPEAATSEIDEINTSFKTFYQDSWRQGTEIFGGILDLLKACNQNSVRMAILSNKPHTFTVEIVAELFPGITFDAVLGQQQGVPKKPAPDGVELCLAALKSPPEKTLFIGDSTVDLQTAKNAGLPCAAVTWGYHDQPALQHEGATHYAQTVSDLNHLILH